jgi:hypothetical protein
MVRVTQVSAAADKENRVYVVAVDESGSVWWRTLLGGDQPWTKLPSPEVEPPRKAMVEFA